MPRQRFTIQQVCDATGLEESEVRFYENVFREFLTFTSMTLDKNEFTQDHIKLLDRIKELINKRGFNLEEVKADLRRFVRKQAAEVQHPAKGGAYARVIAVTSGKGGVGKTSVTVNLAILMARLGRKVAVFDADLGLANVHIIAGVKPRFNLSHAIKDGFSLEDVICEGPAGIKIISGGQGLRDMANLGDEERRQVLRMMDSLEREVDVLFVDTGAGISDNVLRFATFADEVIVVATPNIASASDAYSIIKIILEMDPNAKVGMITNMVQNMYHSKNVFNRINSACETYLDYSLGDLGYIVEDEHVRAANQQRKPLVLTYPNSDATKCLRQIISTILNKRVFSNSCKQSSFSDLIGAIKRSMVGVG